MQTRARDVPTGACARLTATEDYLVRAVGGPARGCGLSLCAFKSSPQPSISGTADGTPQVVFSCSYRCKKAPRYRRGASEPRGYPDSVPSYSIRARLCGAGRSFRDRVRHRTPDVRGEDRSWLRSVSPGNDDAEWLRRFVFLTILFHSDSHLMDATAFLGPLIGTRCATFDLERKSLLMNDLRFVARYCRGGSVAK